MLKKTLTLIDGSGYIFRAYYGLPYMTRSDGLPCNAIYGFCSMMATICTPRQHHYIACVFDSSRQSFRQDIYAPYKANRSAPPDDLIPQFPFFREAAKAFGLHVIEQAGYEADDLIATYSQLAKDNNIHVEVISGDKDLMQLIDENTSLLDPMKNKIITYDDVIDKFGVPPHKVAQVQALSGDSVDNIPGVQGIGPKIASELINEYGDLDNLLQHAHCIKQPKRREKLIEEAEQARISLQLATLCTTAPVEQTIDSLQIHQEKTELLSFLETMEFTSLIKRLKSSDLLTQESPHDEKSLQKKDPITTHIHHITSTKQLHAMIEQAQHQHKIAVRYLTTITPQQHEQQLIALALSWQKGECYFMMITHKPSDLFNQNDHALFIDDVILCLQKLYQQPSICIISHHSKQDWHKLKHTSLLPYLTKHYYDDIMLQSYCLYAGQHQHSLPELAYEQLGYQMMNEKDITPLLQEHKKTYDPAHPHIQDYLCESVDIILRLHDHLQESLYQHKKWHFYHMVERIMPSITFHMEQKGVLLNLTHLEKLHHEFTDDVKHNEQKIFDYAGEEFMISSPKQLGDILFEKLHLPVPSKTKTGQYSTAQDVLEPLADEYPIVRHILDYRHYTKLLNTYVDALPKMASSHQKIHTTYQLTGTQTGRLSSSDPNLQNIPIKDDAGKKIRQAFIASPKCQLVAFDYSQIELRILAEMAQSQPMLQAFADGQDIHMITASEIFNTPLDSVTSMQRRSAKAINFGIIYGMSAFGLAKQIGISRTEANEYIQQYFKKFDGIRDFFMMIDEGLKKNGYVETYFGRRIHLPAIHSKHSMQRQYASRQAMNAPIQGTSADIIKIAMANIYHYITLHHLEESCSMILQVHDELVFNIDEKNNSCYDTYYKITHAKSFTPL